MSSRYTRNSKQILCYGEHFADACDELAAMQILNALQDMEYRVVNKVVAPLRLNSCRVRRENDEMVCACGLRWDVNDPQPPMCVHRAPR